jgi:hypothetical protein
LFKLLKKNSSVKSEFGSQDQDAFSLIENKKHQNFEQKLKSSEEKVGKRSEEKNVNVKDKENVGEERTSKKPDIYKVYKNSTNINDNDQYWGCFEVLLPTGTTRVQGEALMRKSLLQLYNSLNPADISLSQQLAEQELAAYNTRTALLMDVNKPLSGIHRNISAQNLAEYKTRLLLFANTNRNIMPKQSFSQESLDEELRLRLRAAEADEVDKLYLSKKLAKEVLFKFVP